MVQNWIDMYHASDTVLVLYDPIKHVNYIKSMGFNIPENEVYESKILTIEVQVYPVVLAIDEILFS